MYVAPTREGFGEARVGSAAGVFIGFVEVVWWLW